jgi:hypothetical protein
MFIFCFAARSKVAQNHAQVFKCGDRVGKEDDRIDFPRDSRLEVHGIVSKIRNYRIEGTPVLFLSLSPSLCYHLLVASIFFVFSPTSFSYVVEVVGRNVYIHTK